MSLAGNLRTMDLPEVLQWIASARKTGTLHIERRSVTKKIYFQDGETAGDDLIPIDLEVTSAIMEGVRRVDEWGRIRTVFPSQDVSFTLKRAAPADVTDPTARRLLELAGSGLTLAALSLELRRSEFETADLAFRLHGEGFQ